MKHDLLQSRVVHIGTDATAISRNNRYTIMALAINQTERIASGVESNRKSPHPTDKWIGNRIRTMREARGLSQEDLAPKIGVSFQQLQKYELGINRVAGSRFVPIAKALGCSINDLFPPDDSVRVPERDIAHYADNYESLRVLRAYRVISNPSVRALLLGLVELVSRCGPGISN